MKRPWHLDRRTVLRGAGGVAVALPFLEAMTGTRRAWAAPGAGLNGFPKRFLTMFTSNGVVMSTWKPTGADATFQLGASLAPLERHKKDLLVLQGPDNSAGRLSGNPGHHSAALTALTAADIIKGGALTNPDRNAQWGMGGPSIDQAIAAQIAGPTPFKSLAVGTDSGQSNILHFTVSAGPDRHLPVENSPDRLFAKLSGKFPAAGGAAAPSSPSPQALALQARRTSVLSAVKEDYAALVRKLGSADRNMVESHLATLRDLEQSLRAPSAAAGSGCAAPVLDGKTGNQFAAKNFMTMIAAAVACDLTRVVSMQWGSAASRTVYSWLQQNRDHHIISHDGDSNAASMSQLTQIDAFHATNLAYLIDRLKAIPEGPGTAFDNTVIVWIHELSHGASHSLAGMPYVLAGSAGRHFRTGGRFLQVTGRTSNDLFVSLQNAMGIESQTFGTEKYCKGPLPGLT